MRATKLHQTLSRLSINQTGLQARWLALRTSHCALREKCRVHEISRRDDDQLLVLSPASPEHRLLDLGLPTWTRAFGRTLVFCQQGPGTHLQPRKSQCIQNQLTTSMMREMGKLKRNQVPKFTTSAAGYWLEGKDQAKGKERTLFPHGFWE